MPPAAAFSVPRLRPDTLEPFQPRDTYSQAFGLARNLLLAGIAQPDDWELANGDPVSFMRRTLERSATGVNPKAIDAVAHVDILFATSPCPSSIDQREPQIHGRVFLAVEATHISIVYLRATLDLLARVHPRLPVTFYRMLLEGVGPWILCYDESASESFYEWRMESYLEATESGEEGLEQPQDIATAKGPWLARKLRPLSAVQFDRTIATVGPRARARRTLAAAQRLLALASARERTRPPCEIWDEYYPNGSFSVPFTILAFHEQDLVCEAFQSDEEDWLNGGEPQSPAFLVAMDPSDPASMAAGFAELRHFLRMLEALGELLMLMPGCDLLEEQQ